jgi:cytochrome c peroxidase
MASSWATVLVRLQRDSAFVEKAQEIYGGRQITAEIVRDAIAAYESSLVSVGSRFDAYLRGDAAALSAEERRGHQVFKEYGCAACHQGAAVGGNIFQRLGLFGDYFAERGGITQADMGRFNVTGREEDRHVFKVPSLREVARTPPYLHDGSAATLEEAILIMARHQLGRTISGDDVAAIAAFLGALGRPEDGR